MKMRLQCPSPSSAQTAQGHAMIATFLLNFFLHFQKKGKLRKHFFEATSTTTLIYNQQITILTYLRINKEKRTLKKSKKKMNKRTRTIKIK